MDDELVMGVVERVLAKPAADREQFAKSVCTGNDALFEQVWHYVTWDERMDGFLLDSPYRIMQDETGLQSGQMLEDRFRIVRKIAAGGMGVVYEAYDEKLGRRIAIKCARPGFGGRLSPEVRHASEINHPNVCRTWEIHTSSGMAGEFDFLTMEYIEGQTLADLISEREVPDKEAREIAIQISAGLAEAHRQGVVHGDLKSGNVLLAASADRGARVALTDFGLSHGLSTHSHKDGTAPRGGTPEYMAPEVLKGGTPSFSSDIYAFGVILRELAGAERATRPPWARAIAGCLDPEPARRWSSAGQAADALKPYLWVKWLAVAAMLLLAIVAGTFGYRRGIAPHEEIRLAIVPFSSGPGTRSLTEGLLQETAERLRVVKDSRRKLTVIPANNNQAGATHTLSGTLQVENGRIQIHAVLSDARTHFPLKQWDAQYQPQELSSLPVALAGIVTGSLSLPPLPYAATVNGAAFHDFTEGVGLLQQDKVDAALPLLERAVAGDPASPLTHARLAEAQARKYPATLDASWLTRAKNSLHEAEQRNPDLALIWVISGRINEYQGLYEAAESDLKRALEIDARDGDAWRRLGRVYTQNNLFAKAVAAYKQALAVQPEYFLNYQDLCALNIEQGRYREAVSQCRDLVRLAPDVSDAHFALAIPLFCMGAYEEADAEFQRAIQLDPQSSKALFSRAFAITSSGRPAEAIPMFQKAIAMGPVNHLLYSDLGTAYRLAGFSASARKAYAKATELAQTELEQNPRNAILKAQLAYLCAQLGEESRAKSELSQARHLASDAVEVQWWAVLAFETLGNRQEALAILSQLPDESLLRLNREADLAEFRHDPRFLQLVASRNINPNTKE